jgi:hypothetical protein
VLLSLGCAAQAEEGQGQRPHVYAFDQPQLLATQRTFGVGNAVTLLGEACSDDAKAADSYAEWGEINQPVLEQMTTALAEHYRIPAQSNDLQERVAEAMHLKTRLTLFDAALTDACASLSETLALPNMNLQTRYQTVLKEVSHPDYLKLQRTKRRPEVAGDPGEPQSKVDEKTDDREEPTRSE